MISFSIASARREFKGVSNWCYLNLETGLGVSFLYLSVNRRYSIRGLARLGLGLSI
jgi:hypothetical protein